MTGWSPVARDVTDRGSLEETVLDAILNNEQLVVFMKDRDGRYLFTNRTFEQRFSLSHNQALGKSDDDLFLPKHAALYQKNDGKVLEVGRSILLEEVARYDDGEHTNIVLKFPLRDAENNVFAVGGIVIDITVRKEVEKALVKSTRQLQYALDERERLSHDLHDNIIQVLIACGLGIEGLRGIIETDIKKAASEITRVITELNLVIEDIRQYIVGIDPMVRVSPAQIRRELRRITRVPKDVKSPRFRVRLTPSVVSQLSPDQAKHLLLIAREAVSNSVRHARAKTIAVALKRHKRCVRLVVKDDGVGFNPRITKNTGYGLGNMALRAERLKGHFQLVSTRREGTQIFVDLPAAAIGERTVR